MDTNYPTALAAPWPAPPSTAMSWAVSPVYNGTSISGLASSKIASSDGSPIQWYRTFDSIYTNILAPSAPERASQQTAILSGTILYVCVNTQPGAALAPPNAPACGFSDAHYWRNSRVVVMNEAQQRLGFRSLIAC